MPHKLYNESRDQYLTTVEIADAGGTTADLTIIEFDDHGVFWKIEQLEDTIDLIRQRNQDAERGVGVFVFAHGWKNDANPKRGDIARFRQYVSQLAKAQHDAGAPFPDRVVGVFVGWRGATSSLPVHKEATFWSRKRTAERVVSYNMRESLFRIMNATRERPSSKVVIVGHSMGGLIVGKALGPPLTTLMLLQGRDGVRLPADMTVLENPALDGLASWQLLDFLKRSNARLMLKSADGTLEPAAGPLILSLTSEADSATGSAFRFGQTVEGLFRAYRPAGTDGRPGQRYLATRAEGHIDYITSHRAWLEDGEIMLERVPDAYNDTPFWVVRVSADISKDHGDVRNPVFTELIRRIFRLNRLYETDKQLVMFADPEHTTNTTPD